MKNLPAMKETQEVQVQSLDQEDSLEEGMANHSGILAWRVLWTEKLHGLQSTGSQRVTAEATEDTHIVLMENKIRVI